LCAALDVGPLLDEFRAGGRWRSLARAITLIENADPWDVEIPPAAEPVHCVGVTGPPGSGKSTLVGRLIESYLDTGRRVGVVAVDPSSPISGGAVLGDRVRMEQHLAREGAYVRSLASRGATGALAGATRNVARALESSGSFDVVLIETVGAGQTELAIAGLADTVVVVTVPGLGDAVQAIKAGVLEVAEYVIVNMADRAGADETARHFRLALGKEVPVLKTVATEGTGVPELRAKLDERFEALREDGALTAVRQRRARVEAALLAQAWVGSCAENGTADTAGSVHEAVGRLLEEAAARWHR
jgi:LAO/AO transport system kinase